MTIGINKTEFTKMFTSGVAPSAIALHFGCQPSHVTRLARQLGIKGSVSIAHNHTAANANASERDAQRDRIEKDAAGILERVFHRKRWLAMDRDNLAAEIMRIVNREMALK